MNSLVIGVGLSSCETAVSRAFSGSALIKPVIFKKLIFAPVLINHSCIAYLPGRSSHFMYKKTDERGAKPLQSGLPREIPVAIGGLI